MKAQFTIRNADISASAIEAIRSLPFDFVHTVTISEKKRNLDQNAKLWAMLADISEQVVWHGLKLIKEEWKDVFTAGLKRQKVVPGIDGGFVVIGFSTSKMTVSEMSDLIEFAMAFGCQNNVKWSDQNHQP